MRATTVRATVEAEPAPRLPGDPAKRRLSVLSSDPVRRSGEQSAAVPRLGLPALRALVQSGTLVIVLIAGLELFLLYRQVLAGGPLTVHRSPLVEGFLPISALMSLKSLVLSGQWDPVHPAGLTILLAALTISLVARKAFCSWICPVGAVSRGVAALGERWLGRRVEIPASSRLGVALTLPKYLLLGLFLWVILLGLDERGIRAFRHTSYNYVAEIKMLLFFLEPSALTVAVLTILFGLSLLIRNFWCRFLCPYGALLGVLGALSPLRIHRRSDRCTGCLRCTRGCPSEILVHSAREVRSPECTGCLTCVARCPVPGTLTVRVSERRALSPWVVPLLAVGLMTLFWAGARLSGHWETQVPIEVMTPLYHRASTLHHP